jgi:deoxyribonuclease (pyrimidine dimer)
MTRINVGIPVKKLTKAHVIAEHREIKRIPNCIVKGRYNMKGQPEEFTLGTGHVKFFYDKCGYLKKRYEELYARCIELNVNATYFGDAWDDVPKEFMGDYTPTDRDREILIERLIERDKYYKSVF